MKLFFAGLLNYVWNEIVTHVPWHGFRKVFLRLFNKKISSSSVVLLHVRLLNFWKLELGCRSVLNQYVLLDCRKYQVIISSDVDIGPYTRIWTLGHDPNSEGHGVSGGPVTIEDHVWVASSVTILPSVTLEKGCVIAASSTVTSRVPSLEIWGGAPAKRIRQRRNLLQYRLHYTPYFE